MRALGEAHDITMEKATGSRRKASPSSSSSGGLFRRRLGNGGLGGLGAALAAAAQLACVLAVLFCVTSVTSIRSRCHASKATNSDGRSKSNEHERGGTRDPGFGLGCGEMIAENSDKPPTAEVAPF